MFLIEVDLVTSFVRCLHGVIYRQGDVGVRQRRRVVDTLIGHRHKTAFSQIINFKTNLIFIDDMNRHRYLSEGCRNLFSRFAKCIARCE
jgi:hypothetical protein